MPVSCDVVGVGINCETNKATDIMLWARCELTGWSGMVEIHCALTKRQQKVRWYRNHSNLGCFTKNFSSRNFSRIWRMCLMCASMES